MVVGTRTWAGALAVVIALGSAACRQGADEVAEAPASVAETPAPATETEASESAESTSATSEDAGPTEAAPTDRVDATCRHIAEVERLAVVAPELSVQYLDEHEVVDEAPDDMAEPMRTLEDGIRRLAETGDYAVLSTAEFDDADRTLDELMLAGCGWNTLTYTTDDDEFVDFPERVPAGPLALEMDNTDDDVHEGQIFRLDDGETIDDLLEGPVDPYTEARYAGGHYATGGGQSAADDKTTGAPVTFLVLEPGRYVIADLLPDGVSTFAELDSLGPNAEIMLHVDRGMHHEFTVE